MMPSREYSADRRVVLNERNLKSHDDFCGKTIIIPYHSRTGNYEFIMPYDEPTMHSNSIDATSGTNVDEPKLGEAKMQSENIMFMSTTESAIRYWP